MGAALSMQKFLATPLAAQWKFPFVVNPRFCRRRVTTLELTDNFWTHAIDINGYAVREVDSGRVLFRVLPTIEGEVSDGRTKWLLDEYGIPVAHLSHRDHPNAAVYDVCLGKRRAEPKVLTSFMIKFVPGRGEPLLAEVDDPHTGGKSRIGCHGMWRQRAAVLYLERGRGGRREPIAKVGISGIEKRLVDQNNKMHENISQAFEDMSKLMEQAREMVNLSKTITERLRMKKGGEITDDETTQFKSYLLSLGVSDPVTKTTFGTGATYFEKLAEEITEVLLKPLTECGGTMTLPEAYCRINRARGVHLISPEDLLNACQKLDKINSKITMYVFDSGVNVVQLRSVRVDQTTGETADLVKELGRADAYKIALHNSISPVLAKERLLAAETVGKICRDDSVEGLFFYHNRFLESN